MALSGIRVLVTALATGALLLSWPGLAQASVAPREAKGVDYSSVVSTLNQEIYQVMEQGGLVGVTMSLVDGDRVIMRRGFGYADRAADKKVTPDTLFHIGSTSKTFAALAVMQLVEKGLIDLDAPLARYVPEFSLLPRYQDNVVTVRSVLDHHSGIPGDIFNGLITERAPDPGFRDWLLKALAKMPPERRVNTEWAYNNAGYVLLQNVVENVSGQNFEDYTNANIFGVLGMPSSTFNDTTVPDSALTRNYATKKDAQGNAIGPVRTFPREYVNGWAAGSIVSSAADMTQYLQMLVNQGQADSGPVVSPATFRQMTTAQTHLPVDLQLINGICFFLTPASRTGMGRMIGHDGATAYNFTDLLALPDSKLAVFVSTNTEGGSPLVAALAMRALQLAYEAKTGEAAAPVVSLPSAVTVPSQAAMQAVAGRYATSAGYDLINYDEGGLLWTHNAQAGTQDKPAKVMRLAPTDDGWWATPDIPQTQIGFRTLGSKRLMVIRAGGSAALRYAVLGQFAAVEPIPDIWSQRLGTYRQVNANPLVPPFFVAESIVLSVRDGLVTMSAPSGATFVIRPLQADRAYTFGTGLSLGRGMGDALEFEGQRFTSLGVTYEKVTR